MYQYWCCKCHFLNIATVNLELLLSFMILSLFVFRSAAIDVKNKKGNSPLWLACNGKSLIIKTL